MDTDPLLIMIINFANVCKKSLLAVFVSLINLLLIKFAQSTNLLCGNPVNIHTLTLINIFSRLVLHKK